MKHAIQKIHFVGLGGSGMSGIAEVLHNLGYTVSGSDLAQSATLQRLQALGIQAFVGHDAAHVQAVDVVVTSTAVQADNPEVIEARARNCFEKCSEPIFSKAWRGKPGLARAARDKGGK